MPVLVSDNTENRCFLDTTFVRMLLPQLRKQVSIFCEDLLVMFNFKKTDLGENLVKTLNKAKIFHSDIQYLPFCSNKKLFIPGDPDMHAADQWQLSSRNHTWGELASIKMEDGIDVRKRLTLDFKKRWRYDLMGFLSG